MRINLEEHNYLKSLRSAKPVRLNPVSVAPPKGALGATRTIGPQIIPPVNTDIQFSFLPKFKLADHPGLAAIDHMTLPTNFNWAHTYSSESYDIKKKKKLIAKPGNQMLCGSCWAISGAGIVADNFVVSGLVDWVPELSTTWSLACYPQYQCNGGNPAQLFNDISNGGIVSKHCVDYSWCSKSDYCNGKATKHFDGAQVDLNSLIPTCGCYFNTDHFKYKIDKNPKFIAIGSDGITEDNIVATVKKHIYVNGPVMGGFLVFSNFMPGTFTHVNGGVYLENGVYDEGEVRFDDNQISSMNYAGSHAIAVIGWGDEKNIVVDNSGKKTDVPYWYCRNSWTDKWGDKGYFKMAMYPFNKTVQFENIVQMQTASAIVQGGGMVMVNASEGPTKVKLGEIDDYYRTAEREKTDDYYKDDPQDYQGNDEDEEEGGSKHHDKLWLVCLIALIITIILLTR